MAFGVSIVNVLLRVRVILRACVWEAVMEELQRSLRPHEILSEPPRWCGAGGANGICEDK